MSARSDPVEPLPLIRCGRCAKVRDAKVHPCDTCKDPEFELIFASREDRERWLEEQKHPRRKHGRK